MSEAHETKTRFEGAAPILNVKDMSVSLKYYVDVLGFKKADWGQAFTSVSRDNATIYLCQGWPGTTRNLGLDRRRGRCDSL
jgi:hypothetical protein